MLLEWPDHMLKVGSKQIKPNAQKQIFCYNWFDTGV